MSLDKPRLVKQLTSQRKKLLADIKATKENVSMIQKELSLKEKRLNELNSSIKSINTDKTIQLTEHAYFERVIGYDLNKIKDEIINDKLLKMNN